MRLLITPSRGHRCFRFWFCPLSRPREIASPKFGAWGVDLTSMDKAVKPGDNFYDYVNGAWAKKAVIPPDRSWTGSFPDLQIRSEVQLRAIVDDLEKKPLSALNPEERKLRDLYDAFEDTAAIEKNGLKPIQKDLDYLNGLKTPEDVARAMASPRMGTESIYGISINVDDKNPNSYSINLNQGGLGLPDRDYYLSTEKNLVATRTAYQKYLSDMMKLAGMDDPDARALRIVALETEIAKVQWTRADRRDEDKVYNPMQVSALKTLAPEFPWNGFSRKPGFPPLAATASPTAATSSWRKRPPSRPCPNFSWRPRCQPGATI